MHTDDVQYWSRGPGYSVTDQQAVPIHGRELARRLRRAQNAAGLDGVALSRAAGMSESRVSRITNGVLCPPVADVIALLTVCGVVGDERDRLLDLCHPRHEADTLRISDGTQWEAFLYHAGQADRLTEYQPLMIPWIAQDEEYVKAYWSPLRTRRGPGPWTAKLNRGDAAGLLGRLSRAELLVHEWALRAPVTGLAARSAQMHGLLTLSKASNIALRVIPASWVLPTTAVSGFTVLEFANRRTVVYREEPASAVFVDDPVQVAAHLEIVRQLRQIALKPQRTSELVKQIKDEPAPDLAPADLFPG